MKIDYGKVINAIKEFNRLFHADCELISINKEEITVLFKGHICFTCGAYDYFEDLAYILSQELGEEIGVKEYTQTDRGEYIVKFAPKKNIKSTKRDIKIVFYV